MPRLFASIEISHEVASALSLLRGGLSGARWIDRENYHLTLRFIGDVEAPMADAIADSLDGVRQSPFSLTFNALGVFGGKKPRSLFAVPDGCNALIDLQADIDRRCKRLGLAPDGRKFTPHVTLARLRDTSAQAAANYIGLRGGFFAPSQSVGRFVLMSSRDSTGGGPYIVEQAYRLGQERQDGHFVPARVGQYF